MKLIESARLQIERFDVGRWVPESGMCYDSSESSKATDACKKLSADLGVPCRIVSIRGERAKQTFLVY
jgi:hypothetical protein